jgi:hypothetical protein
MYQPFNLAENLLLIHRITVDGELQRQQPERHLRFRDIDRSGPLAAARRGIARGFIALGTRLDPTVGAPAPTASGLRA